MILYLHGFASSPASSKARFFSGKLRELGQEVVIPRLDGGNFEGLTLSSQMRILEEAADGRPVTVMGSSMGGYLAALFAARHDDVERVILMAPAFDFAARWKEQLGNERFSEWRQTGFLPVYHYAIDRESRVGFELYEDAQQFEAYPEVRQPTLIFHGLRDEVVSVELSREFMLRNPSARLEVFDSGHELTDVTEPMWESTRRFLEL